MRVKLVMNEGKMNHEIGSGGTAKMDCGCGFYRKDGNLVVARCVFHDLAPKMREALSAIIYADSPWRKVTASQLAERCQITESSAEEAIRTLAEIDGYFLDIAEKETPPPPPKTLDDWTKSNSPSES